MNTFADLHIHTHYSDGTQSPSEIVQEALACGLAAVSITDHDTIEGVALAKQEARAFNLEIVPGIELSCEIHGKDVHILGYFIDCDDEHLNRALLEIQNIRVQRMESMIGKLKRLGIADIDMADVLSLTRSRAVGRLHLALVLKEKGKIASLREAFEKYIGEEGPAYVKKFKQTPREAIALIRRAGGVAVLAHPMITNKDELIPGFVEAGLGGIEVYYPNYSEITRAYYEGLAKKNKLIATGGSDAHGLTKDSTYIGKIRVPCTVVDQLRELRGK